MTNALVVILRVLAAFLVFPAIAIFAEAGLGEREPWLALGGALSLLIIAEVLAVLARIEDHLKAAAVGSQQ